MKINRDLVFAVASLLAVIEVASFGFACMITWEPFWKSFAVLNVIYLGFLVVFVLGLMATHFFVKYMGD